MYPESLGTGIPNLLTAARLALTPFIARSLLRSDCSTALVLIAVAGATDAADGYLARSFRWQSKVGAYLDPIADKLLMTALYICLGVLEFVPEWLVWLIVGRDALILGMVFAGFALTSIREFPPSASGKISTAIQIGSALAAVISCGPVSWWVVMVTAIATTFSGIDYLMRGVRMWRAQG